MRIDTLRKDNNDNHSNNNKIFSPPFGNLLSIFQNVKSQKCWVFGMNNTLTLSGVLLCFTPCFISHTAIAGDTTSNLLEHLLSAAGWKEEPGDYTDYISHIHYKTWANVDNLVLMWCFTAEMTGKGEEDAERGRDGAKNRGCEWANRKQKT